MFRFRLERVLQHRQREVDARSRDVATTQLAVQEAEAARIAADRQLQQCRADLAAGRQGRLDATALQRATAWQDELVSRCESAQENLESARRALIAAQERLQQAWRDREVLERLRSRQRQEWQQEQERREQHALDEIGSIRSALAGRGDRAGSGSTSPGGD
jgi:flagellar FliJ protein